MRSKWLILTLSFFTMVVMFIPYIGYSLGTLDIMEEFGLSYSSVGLLATITAITGGIALPFAGYLSDKVGCKKLILAGLTILLLGQILFAVAPVYELLLLARVFSGIGVGVLIVAPYTIVVHWFSSSNAVGFGMGTMLSADGVGTLIATYLFGAIMIAVGWRSAISSSAIVIIIILILGWILLKDSPTFERNETLKLDGKTIKRLLKNRNVISGIIVISALFSVFNLSVYWIPTILMEEAKWGEGAAGFTSSLFPLVGIIGSLAFGTLSDNLLIRKRFIIIATIGLAMSFIGLSIFYVQNSYVMLAILLALAGFFAYGASSVTYALVAESVSEKEIGLANGLVIGTGMIVGGSIVPLLIGGVKDYLASYTVGFIVIAAYLILFLIAISFFAKDVRVPTKTVVSQEEVLYESSGINRV